MADVPDEPQFLPGFPPAMAAPEPPRAWRPGDEAPAWNLWETASIFVVFFVSVIVAGAVALGIAAHVGGEKGRAIAELARDPRIIVPAQTAAYVVTVLFIFIVVRTHAGRVLRALRWNFPSQRVMIFAGAGVLLSFLVQGTSWLLPIPKSLPIENLFRNATDAWIMTVFGCTVAPLVEELLFRGILYPALARRLGMMASIVITALGFTLLHTEQLAFAWAPLLMLFAVGLALTIVRARTGSVGASFLVHVGYNFTIFVLVWLGSDHFRHLEKMTS